MKILIVYAHPEPRSLNGKMRDVALTTLRAAGHEVRVSDLYAMNFKAVADRDDFGVDDQQFFHLQTEQDRAWEHRSYPRDIAEEQEKLIWADLLILQFPFWWQSVPAILKGWFDRVLSRSFSYGKGRAFADGGLRGKRAFCALTTGTPEAAFRSDGFYGYDISVILRHVLHGTLAFVGYEVLPPFVVWSAPRLDASEEARYLDTYRQRLLALE